MKWCIILKPQKKRAAFIVWIRGVAQFGSFASERCLTAETANAQRRGGKESACVAKAKQRNDYARKSKLGSGRSRTGNLFKRDKTA